MLWLLVSELKSLQGFWLQTSSLGTPVSTAGFNAARAKGSWLCCFPGRLARKPTAQTPNGFGCPVPLLTDLGPTKRWLPLSRLRHSRDRWTCRRSRSPVPAHQERILSKTPPKLERSLLPLSRRKEKHELAVGLGSAGTWDLAGVVFASSASCQAISPEIRYNGSRRPCSNSSSQPAAAGSSSSICCHGC